MIAARNNVFQSAPGDRSPGDCSSALTRASFLRFNPRPVIAHRATHQNALVESPFCVSIRAR
jgi:hypothetical protein